MAIYVLIYMCVCIHGEKTTKGKKKTVKICVRVKQRSTSSAVHLSDEWWW